MPFEFYTAFSYHDSEGDNFDLAKKIFAENNDIGCHDKYGETGKTYPFWSCLVADVILGDTTYGVHEPDVPDDDMYLKFDLGSV